MTIVSIIAILFLGVLWFLYNGPKVPSQTNEWIKEIQAAPLSEFIKGTTGTATNKGIDIFYEAIGQPEKGDILLVNGHTQTMLDWPAYFYQPLVEAGYRVIRYDNRGVGMSDWMANWTKENAYNLEDMATDGIAILNTLGIKQAHIIGMSMGGMIGQRMAISHSEQVLSLTSIMSTGYYDDDTLVSTPRQFIMDIGRIGLTYGRNLKTEAGKLKLHLAIRRLLKGKGDYPFDDKYILQKALYEVRNRKGYNMKGTDQHSLAIKKSGSRYEDLKKLHLPVLVVHGTTDPLVPFTHAEKYAPMIPHARTLFIEGMGHDIPDAYSPKIVGAIFSLLAEANPTLKNVRPIV